MQSTDDPRIQRTLQFIANEFRRDNLVGPVRRSFLQRSISSPRNSFANKLPRKPAVIALVQIGIAELYPLFFGDQCPFGVRHHESYSVVATVAGQTSASQGDAQGQQRQSGTCTPEPPDLHQMKPCQHCHR